MRWLTLAITIILFSLSFSPLAQASSASSSPVTTGWLQHPDHPPVEVRLSLTGVTQPESNEVEGLLEVRLQNDWKTYWRSPGEGGIAPMASWQHSNNLAAVQWQWPAPERYSVSGVETVGYKENVAFPLTFQVNQWHQPVLLQGVLTMSSCTDICVLTDYNINLEFIPPQLVPNSDMYFRYQQALSQVPSLLSTTSNENMEVKEAYWLAQRSQLQVRLQALTNLQNPDVFIDSLAPDLRDITVKQPQISYSGNELELVVNIEHWLGDLDLVGQPIQLSIIDNHFAYELQIEPIAGSMGGLGNNSEPLHWGMLILFSLLGGLILNIMPCVLPVLGMKLQSVLTENRQQGLVRKQFLASAAGIVVSFWLIAAGLLVLKYSGSAIGWGIQFQSPYFLGFMVMVTWLFTLNLAGVFSLRLPSNMNTWAATKGDQSMAGHFVQGMFATLLATPCSAPFLGTAIGFALAASALQMFTIFTLLGIGMALPWILVAAKPRLALLLPKPGNWMNITKVVFSFMLAATTVWLLFLFRGHLNLSVWRFIFVTIALITGVLVWRTYGAKGVAISFVFGFLSLFGAIAFAVLSADDLNAQPNWEKLQVQQINQEVAAGKVVFVDVTAKWCITCKANEVGVLLQNPVYKALQASDVVLMQGDWTVPNDYVTSYLKIHNRYGVPFNIVYGPSAPYGIELPVILTSQAVINALEQAR
ncbi:protein-disulfide reductase DsbD family protein [Aliidiomarina quisquiliarum]|uniref:protein-disulfide reductase DsbD family protein n=1 Tax=Aliidiomarina quisquiliarum TaxID=2938947 RepID=UPI00208F70FE|nr:protein-disulfide reductase DsbD domain-containing protein [Aliidiomarina quisquiliarum]MCO4321361.1 thioredoxin family protein [Aliidiomarina quisquiliarum]